MDIRFKDFGNGTLYICLTDINTYLWNNNLTVINLSSALRSVPDSYKIVTRGRHGRTYIKASYLEQFLSCRRNIPNYIKKLILKITQSKIETMSGNSLESVFIDYLESFLKEMMPDLVLKRQFNLEDKYYDFSINEKILIEFDEKTHDKCIENDLLKDKIAKNNNFILIRIKAQQCYGKSVAIIYKKIKKLIY